MEPRRFAGHLPGCCRSEWVRFAETPSDQPEFSGVAAHLVGAGGVPHLANPRPTVEQKRDPPTYVESQRFAGPPRGQFFGDGSRFMGGGPADPPKFTDSTTRMKRAAEFHRRESMADCEDISRRSAGFAGESRGIQPTGSEVKGDTAKFRQFHEIQGNTHRQLRRGAANSASPEPSTDCE